MCIRDRNIRIARRIYRTAPRRKTAGINHPVSNSHYKKILRPGLKKPGSAILHISQRIDILQLHPVLRPEITLDIRTGKGKTAFLFSQLEQCLPIQAVSYTHLDVYKRQV